MKRTLWHLLVLVALVAPMAGCARKVAETPPTPTGDTTPPAPVPTPPTTPPDEPVTPVPQGGLSADDFQPVFFDYDSYALRDDARSALDQNAKTLRDNASANVTIEGHCDERGTVEYNLALGERRANAAKDYLVGAGISASRLTTLSYGKERPFDPGQDESAWAKNRRAHFTPR